MSISLFHKQQVPFEEYLVMISRKLNPSGRYEFLFVNIYMGSRCTIPKKRKVEFFKITKYDSDTHPYEHTYANSTSMSIFED